MTPHSRTPSPAPLALMLALARPCLPSRAAAASPTLSASSLEFNLNPVSVTMALNGYELTGLRTYTALDGGSYTRSGDTITFLRDYLNNEGLPVTVYFDFTDGSTASLVISAGVVGQFAGADAEIAADAAGNLYLADRLHGRIVEVPAASGSYWGVAMESGNWYPVPGATCDGEISGLAVDAAGSLYYSCLLPNAVLELAAVSGTQFGIPMTAGNAYPLPFDPSPARDVEVDSHGNVYVAFDDGLPIAVLAGETATRRGLAMTAGTVYSLAGTTAHSLAIDANDNLYLGSYGDLSEIAGSSGHQWGAYMTEGGNHSLCQLVAGVCDNDVSVAVDASGNLYFTSDFVLSRMTVQWDASLAEGNLYQYAGWVGDLVVGPDGLLHRTQAYQLKTTDPQTTPFVDRIFYVADQNPQRRALR